MDRPAATPPSGDDHWAPDHLVLARQVLSHAGRLLVERDPSGEVVTSSPLAGMAAVEQRHPAWALGPFGRIEPERPLPGSAGVFALVLGGVVQYVGSSGDLARTFGPRGLGHISRREAQRASNEEQCRLNRLVVAEARAGRTVDLYLMTVETPWLSSLTGGARTRAAEVAAPLVRATKGSWHLPH